MSQVDQLEASSFAVTGTSTYRMPRVNLLPPEIVVRRRLRTVRFASGGAVAVAIVAVAALAVVAAGGVGPAQQDVDSANAQQASLQQQAGGFGDVTSTYAKADQLDQLLATASEGEMHWSSYLNALARTTPKNVWLTKVSVAPTTAGAATVTGASPLQTVSFDGVALSHNDVAHWLDVLAQQRGYSDPYFSKSAEETMGGRSVYVFSVTVSMNQDALLSNAAQGGN